MGKREPKKNYRVIVVEKTIKYFSVSARSEDEAEEMVQDMETDDIKFCMDEVSVEEE